MTATTSFTKVCSPPGRCRRALSSVLVFADDWGRHPSSCQHLIRHLLDRYEVHWVNTIGTRTPRLDGATLSRGLEKVRQWSRRSKQDAALPRNLHVLNPRMWPWFGSRISRRLNRSLLLRQLRPLVESLPEPPVAVTTLPIVADLVGALPVRQWVYYCVDDFTQWPGLDHKPLRETEERLVAGADVLVAVSETLRDKLARMGRSAHLLTHGVDLPFWKGGGAGSVDAVRGLQHPLVVFWGVVDRRMDVAFIRRLAADLAEGTIVLAGPEADPDPALAQMERVVRVGRLEFDQLPSLARDAAVLIMPYADLPATRAMQPLKLKEYLATGRPVVVRRLPATEEWGDCLDLADSPEAFSEAVRRRVGEGVSTRQTAARRRLARETWAEKARAFECWAISETSARAGAPLT
jgi:glycosyltransferase involved in cell wall biosynthesis